MKKILTRKELLKILAAEFRAVMPKNKPLGPDVYTLCTKQAQAIIEARGKK